jgi:hypothetical protein
VRSLGERYFPGSILTLDAQPEFIGTAPFPDRFDHLSFLFAQFHVIFPSKAEIPPRRAAAQKLIPKRN